MTKPSRLRRALAEGSNVCADSLHPPGTSEFRASNRLPIARSATAAKGLSNHEHRPILSSPTYPALPYRTRATSTMGLIGDHATRKPQLPHPPSRLPRSRSRLAFAAPAASLPGPPRICFRGACPARCSWPPVAIWPRRRSSVYLASAAHARQKASR